MKIAIIDIIGIPYDGSTVYNQGLGGSESAVTFVSAELAELGFDVTVFNTCNLDHAKPGVYDGVTYRPLHDLALDHEFDVVISSRTVIPFTEPKNYPDLRDGRAMPFQAMNLYDRILSKAKMRILWMHDTFCLGDHILESLAVSNRITDIFTLSDWHSTYIANCDHGNRRNFEVLKNKLFITRNGAKNYNTEVDIAAKDPNLFVYNASVTKGMIPLVEIIWPIVKSQIPQAKLKIIGGYYRFSTNTEPDEQEKKWRVMANDPKNISLGMEFTGVIPQKEIANILTNASFMIYPSAFPETFGISTLESLLYNTPAITCRFGALEEIALENSCYLIDYAIEPNGLFPNINKMEQVNKFINVTLQAYHNKYLHQQKQYYCNIIKDIAGWDGIALQWKQHIFRKTGAYLSRDEYRTVTKLNHRVHKVWQRRYHNAVELESHKLGTEKEIYVVSPFYNGANYIARCIESVAAQDYDNYTHVLIDDKSTDNGVEIAIETIGRFPDNIRKKFILITNGENKGAPYNQISFIRTIKNDDAIVILLDGDDSLINDNSIFNYYNTLYTESTEFSYGSCWSMVDNIPLIAQPYPKAIKETRAYRQHKFNWNMPYTHLRTFKKGLLNDISDSMFKDEDGNWYKAGGDGSVFYALIETADPSKVTCVQDIVYNYNDINPLNDYKVNGSEQTKNANSILTKKSVGGKYSIVVPTMWRCNDVFLPFIDKLCACDLVDDIIIINNDNTRTPDKDFSDPKIRMFDFNTNMFVNPSWNFGVKMSRNDRVCIINDDVSYDLAALDKLYDMLTPENGIFGLCPGVSDFDQIPVTDKSIDIIEWAGHHTYGFGCLMWIHKKSWIDVPDGLDLYYGDNFIFDIQLRQKKKNYIVANIDFFTPFASTLKDKEISGGFLEKESVIYEEVKKNMESYIPSALPAPVTIDAIPVEKKKKPTEVAKPTKRILIGIPTANNIEATTFKAIYDLKIPDGYVADFQFFFGYQVDQVRNLIADWVVRGYDYLFSVDSDISFAPDTLTKLLAHNKDVVSGLYIQRIPGTHTLELYEKNGHGGVSNIPVDKLPANSLYEIAGCGFGCALVKREVMVAIGYPQFKYYSAIDHKNTISEDVDFCRKALEKGFRIWADTSIICAHTGKFTFNVETARMNGSNPGVHTLPTVDPVQERLKSLQMMKLLPENHVNHMMALRDQQKFTPKVVYDIGACVLHWTNEAKTVWPTAEFIAFEAIDTAEFLYKEKGMRYQMGVFSDVDGKEVDFYQNNNDPGGNSYYRENPEFSSMVDQLYNESHRRRLKTITLDTAVAKNKFPLPDLIKIDVQGAELDVLRGGLNTIKNVKHIILELQHVEYNKGAPHCDVIIEFMKEQGFDCTGMFNDSGPDGDYHFINRAFLDK